MIMSFYERIAPYYDEIFPVGEDQLGFIMKTAGKPPKRLLDVACGSGTYTVRLAQEGYEMWACDIDRGMAELAESRAKEHGFRVNVIVSDMLDLNKNVNLEFDCVFCIGNSIVHLGSAGKVGEAVLQMKNLLGPGGRLILQIINFDRILEKGITRLPTITNADKRLEFKRNYTLDQGTGLIHFDTVLTAEENDRIIKIENRVDLYPLKARTLKKILEESGFRDICLYGGFNGETFVWNESYLLVALAAF